MIFANISIRKKLYCIVHCGVVIDLDGLLLISHNHTQNAFLIKLHNKLIH